tara:strand:- start:1272 stop:1973 length:702 start_codon:yes stop_codon:yes gene_type:complete
MKILAIILARGGSKRIPQKNLKKINGKSLVEITINQAFSSKYIKDVIVSTDDSTIRKVSLESGAKVIDRPLEYKDDNTINEADNIIIDLIKKLEINNVYFDTFVLLYPTAPLRTTEDIDRTIEKLTVENFDSALTLVKDHSYMWQSDIKSSKLSPINYDPKKRMPSTFHNFVQYRENKAVYAFTRELIIKSKCRIGGKIGFILMSPLYSIDIDNPEDLTLAKILTNLQNQEKL